MVLLYYVNYVISILKLRNFIFFVREHKMQYYQSVKYREWREKWGGGLLPMPSLLRMFLVMAWQTIAPAILNFISQLRVFVYRLHMVRYSRRSFLAVP